MTVRILRALRRFDWATAADIVDALDIAERTDDRAERNSFDKSLGRLCQRGCVERKVYSPGHSGFTYRITQRGRDQLAIELGRSMAA